MEKSGGNMACRLAVIWHASAIAVAGKPPGRVHGSFTMARL